MEESGVYKGRRVVLGVWIEEFFFRLIVGFFVLLVLWSFYWGVMLGSGGFIERFIIVFKGFVI